MFDYKSDSTFELRGILVKANGEKVDLGIIDRSKNISGIKERVIRWLLRLLT